MRKKIKQYTAVLLTVTMSLPGTMAYGNVDSLDAASGVVDASGYLKASTSNAQQTIHIASPSDADEDEDEKELIDDRKKASPSDAEFDEEDVFTKIYDFIWQDPEEYLNDGRLELSATAEEQPTFEQIVSILPQSILAKTGETPENTSVDEAEDEAEDITADYDVEITVSDWQCEDYIQNEDGTWPTSGIFTFSAEPEDGYELADGCAPLAVEVAVSDEAAMLAAGAEIYMVFKRRDVNDENNVKAATVEWDGEELSGDYVRLLDKGDNRIYCEGNTFVLELNNYNPTEETSVEICQGTWIIKINGENCFDGTDLPNGSEATGLIIWDGADVSFQGSGTLTVNGTNEGISILEGATVSVDLNGGSITASSYTSPASDNTTKRYGIYSLGTLNIESGSVTTSGADYGLYQDNGAFRMTGGVLTANKPADNSRRCVLKNVQDFTIAGKINAFTAIVGSTGKVTNNKTAELEYLRTENSSSLIIDAGATLKINNELVTESGGKLINNGKFQTDLEKTKSHNYENNGNVSGANAELWRTPSNLKQTGNTSESSRKLITKNTPCNVTELFNAKEIEETVTYYYRTGNDTKEVEISGGSVTFSQDGEYEIIAKTSGSDKYQRGTAIAYVLVNSNNYYVSSIPFVYTGSWQPIFKVYGLQEEEKVQYQLYMEKGSGSGDWSQVVGGVDKWFDGVPGGTNVYDSTLAKRKYKIQVLKGNTAVYTSELLEKPTVKGKSIDSEDISATPSWTSFKFDDYDNKPDITLKDTARNEVLQYRWVDKPDYKVSYQRDGKDVYECREVGNYTAVIQGTNNYEGSRTIDFTIESHKLTPEITIDNSSKPYDGTKRLASNQQITLKWINEQNEDVTSSIKNSSYQAEYKTENVTDDNEIIVTVALSKADSKKYSLTATSLSIPGSITKAAADKLQHSVVLNPSTVDYENRANAVPIVTVNSKIPNQQIAADDYKITYSCGTIQNATSLSKILEKLNAQDTPYTISYQIATDNYETANGTFPVTIQKSSLKNKGIIVTGYNGEYDGTSHTISVTRPAGVPTETKIEYKGSVESEWSQNLPSYTKAGEYTVDYKISCPNYKDLEGSQTVHIRQKSLTVTAKLKNPERGVIYGDPMPEFEASYIGFVKNDTKEKALTGTPVMTCSTYTQNSGAGTMHTIEVEAGSVSAQNYKLTFTPGSFTVGKKQASIQVTNYNEWKAYTYDGKSPEIEAAVEGERTVKVEIYAGNPASGSALAEIPKNVGTYTAKFTAAETANYEAAEISLPFDIVQRELKVTAVNQSITYGDPAPQYTAVYAGFAAGESLESLKGKGTLSFTCAYQQAQAGQSNKNSNAGTYTITPAVTGLDNYKVTPVAGTLTVGKKAPTFTDSALWKEKYPDGSRVYDGTSVNITPSTDGDGARSYIVENTETGEVLKTDPVNVGTYKATYSVAEGTNYQAGSISYEFAITEAGMKNVMVNGYDGIYDGHSHGIEVSVQDKLVKDEVVEYGLEPDTYTGTDAPELIDAGTYTVYYRITAPNYKPYTGSAIVTIKQKEIQVVTADQETTYLEEAPNFTVDSVNGMVGEETLENQNAVLSFVTAYTKGDDVGEYAVQAVVDGLKNYKVEVVPGTLKVQRRTPVFTDSANLYEARVYDGKAVDLTPTTDGDGQMSRVITNRETNEILTSDPVDVGAYRVVYSVSEGKNYTEGSVSYDFAITQAPLVITAEDKNVTFGFKAPEYTVVYDGFVNGETEAVLTGTLVVTCDYTEEGREATYAIVPSGLSAKNYAITWKNGVLTGRYPESDNDDYEEPSKPANSKMPNSGTNNPGQGATQKDAQKGYVNENSGIVSGKTLTEEMLKNNSESLKDGYSHWIKTNEGWWFRYADGSYPKAAGTADSGSGNSSAAQNYVWIQIDGIWWAFDSKGYLSTGWIFDPVYRSWFYVDVNTGMKTGWVQIDGKWYYFNPVSDGTKGIMFANRMTPDGWFVREDGSWDEKR